MKKLEEECFSFYCDHEKEEAEPEVFETTAGLENGRETFCLLETLESDPKPEILKAKMLYLNGTINMAMKGSRCLFASSIPEVIFDEHCKNEVDATPFFWVLGSMKNIWTFLHNPFAPRVGTWDGRRPSNQFPIL